MRKLPFILCVLGIVFLLFWHFSQENLGLVSIYALPDPVMTPGVINQNITQANIQQTICNKNWTTKSIRPPVSYTNKLKAEQIKLYKYKDINLSDFEEDHLIALTDGGNPTDPKNLWPQPYSNGAKEKDKLEMVIHQKICLGEITLKQGQDMLSKNWVGAYMKYGLDKKLGGVIIDEDDL